MKGKQIIAIKIQPNRFIQKLYQISLAKKATRNKMGVGEKMKKLYLIILFALAGCLNTQNRKIEMRTERSVAAIDSSTAVVNSQTPSNCCESRAECEDPFADLEYFDHHAVRWPRNFKPAQKPESERSQPREEPSSSSKLY